MNDAGAHPPTILLLGPTASGKSAIAMRLAREMPVEIISVDSAQVYRGMDIGTAKPSAHDRAQVPHHLIDIIDPCDSYSAARFAQDARRLIDEIRARGRIPLLVGGTMLYAKALTDGLHELPGADAALRALLEARAARDGWPALHRELALVDPDTAARLDPNDAQRIQRALEINELAGEPMSRLLARSPRPVTGERFLRIALEPSDRAELHRRIEARLHAMIAEGLIDEVTRLREHPGLHAGLPSIRCVGYRQMWEHLEGRYDRDEASTRAVAATRQLAKRQLTWLRSMPGRAVIDCLDANAFDHVLRLIADTP